MTKSLAENTTSDTELHFLLDKVLSETIDNEVVRDLDHWLEIVKKKSRALASSLKRCFENARKSMRYVIIYKLGQVDASQPPAISRDDEELEKYLENHLKEYFEKNDFMHYREFVRLLRACTIDLGGDISFEIKKRYKDFFSGKRLITSYKLGLSKQCLNQ